MDFTCVAEQSIGRKGLMTFIRSLRSVEQQPEGEFFIELDGDYTSTLGNAFAVMDNVVVYEKQSSEPTLKDIYLLASRDEKLTVTYINPFRLNGEITCIRSEVTFQSVTEVIQPSVFNEETYKDFKCNTDQYVGREDLIKFVKSLKGLERHPEGEFFVMLGKGYTSPFGNAFAVMDDIVVYKRKPREPALKDIYLFSPQQDKLTVAYISPFHLNGEIYCIKTQTTLETRGHDTNLLTTVDY